MSCVPLFRCRTGLSKRAPDGPIHVPNTPPGPNTARTRLRATEIIVCLLACLFVLLCFSCVRILATRTRVHSRQHHLALVSAHFGIIITIPAVSSHQGFGQKAEDTPFSRYIGQPALQNSSLPHFVQSSMLLVWVTFLSQERNSTTFLSSWLRRHGVGAGGRAGRGWLVVGSREGPDPAGAKLHPGLDHDRRIVFRVRRDGSFGRRAPATAARWSVRCAFRTVPAWFSSYSGLRSSSNSYAFPFRT
jgi:hypothetical protein